MSKRTRHLTAVFRVLYQIVSTAVIVLGMLIAVLYLCGIRLYHVRSGSMGELLPVGCMCFVSTYTPYDSINAGDVIAFRLEDDLLVTHRAKAVTAEGIFTQGDANENPDPDPVTPENYIGKTVFAIPHIGAGLAFFHTLRGKIVIGIGVLLLLVAGFFYRKESE